MIFSLESVAVGRRSANRFRMSDALILVVDDQPASAEPLQEHLEEEGFHTAWARDGLEALVLSESIKPDLVLLKLVLPVMDGLEFLRHRPGASLGRAVVPVVVHSAVPAYLSQALDLGAASAISSKVWPRTLADPLRAILLGASNPWLEAEWSERPSDLARIPPRDTEVRLPNEPWLQCVSEQFEVDAISIGRVFDGRIRHTLIRTRGSASKGTEIVPSERDAPCQLVFQSEGWLGVGDFDENSLFRTSQWRQLSGYRCYSGVPLRSSGAGPLLGVLGLHWCRPRVLSHAHRSAIEQSAETLRDTDSAA